jgi:hypothetical protein
MSFWTNDKTDALRKLHAEGKTFSEIAETVGNISRSAVPGKCRRLGLHCTPAERVARRHTLSFAGRTHTEETRQKISAAMRLYWYRRRSLETRVSP